MGGSQRMRPAHFFCCIMSFCFVKAKPIRYFMNMLI